MFNIPQRKELWVTTIGTWKECIKKHADFIFRAFYLYLIVYIYTYIHIIFIYIYIYTCIYIHMYVFTHCTYMNRTICIYIYIHIKHMPIEYMIYRVLYSLPPYGSPFLAAQIGRSVHRQLLWPWICDGRPGWSAAQGCPWPWGEPHSWMVYHGIYLF